MGILLCGVVAFLGFGTFYALSDDKDKAAEEIGKSVGKAIGNSLFGAFDCDCDCE